MRRPASGKRPKHSFDKAALVGRMAGALPRASRRGRAQVAQWLSSIKQSAAGKAIASLVDERPPLANVLGGIADSSPYLSDLVRADPARFLHLLSSDADAELTALLATTRKAAAAAKGPAALMRILRRAKSDAALLIGLADIGGVWPVARVTAALTDVAETTLGAAVRHLLGEALARGKLVAPDPRDPEAGSGYVVLAMGKMGGHELNFSSDIDLMVFFDPAVGELAPDVGAAAFYVRVTRDLVKLLQERTADGYVFRVDLRLRPDPASTQIAISTEAALDY
jgi:[glutamine synthetase] adenylyltransferase / [glutamine synthetase]-adenylyl-L-tyrosine phosphorylase